MPKPRPHGRVEWAAPRPTPERPTRCQARAPGTKANLNLWLFCQGRIQVSGQGLDALRYIVQPALANILVDRLLTDL